MDLSYTDVKVIFIHLSTLTKSSPIIFVQNMSIPIIALWNIFQLIHSFHVMHCNVIFISGNHLVHFFHGTSSSFQMIQLFFSTCCENQGMMGNCDNAKNPENKMIEMPEKAPAQWVTLHLALTQPYSKFAIFHVAIFSVSYCPYIMNKHVPLDPYSWVSGFDVNKTINKYFHLTNSLVNHLTKIRQSIVNVSSHQK